MDEMGGCRCVVLDGRRVAVLDRHTCTSCRVLHNMDTEMDQCPMPPLGCDKYEEEADALNYDANIEMGIDPMLADGDWGNK